MIESRPCRAHKAGLIPGAQTTLGREEEREKGTAWSFLPSKTLGVTASLPETLTRFGVATGSIVNWLVTCFLRSSRDGGHSPRLASDGFTEPRDRGANVRLTQRDTGPGSPFEKR